MASIKVGDKIPDATLMYLDDDNQSQKFNLHEKLEGKKALFIGVPGAFTPTWSQKHIPSFIEHSEEIKSKGGVSDVIVISVNDQFVMKAWERSFDGAEHLKFLADGSAEFTKALDLELDLSEKGLGKRSRQYSLLVNDLAVEAVNLDKDGQFADFEEVRQWNAGKVVDLDEGGQFADFKEGGQWGAVKVDRRQFANRKRQWDPLLEFVTFAPSPFRTILSKDQEVDSVINLIDNDRRSPHQSTSSIDRESMQGQVYSF